jgi:uncharacterized membrane protein
MRCIADKCDAVGENPADNLHDHDYHGDNQGEYELGLFNRAVVVAVCVVVVVVLIAVVATVFVLVAVVVAMVIGFAFVTGIVTVGAVRVVVVHVYVSVPAA